MIDCTRYFDSNSFLTMRQRLITTSMQLWATTEESRCRLLKLAEAIPVAEGWPALRDPDVRVS